MRLVFTSADAPATEGALALLMHEGEAPAGALAAFDAASGGAVARAAANPRFTAAKGRSVELVAPAGGVERALVMSVGPREGRDLAVIEDAAASAYKTLKASGETVLTLAFDASADEAAQAAFGVKLAAYRFDRYRTKEKPEAKPSIEEVRIAVSDPAAAEAAFVPLSAIADGVILTRDLVSEPPNVLHPEEFARRCQALAPLGLEVQVLGEAEMLAAGFGSLLAVGHGSVRESQLVALKWMGGSDPAAAPIAFVGKGVTFDTGGISLKPADGMEDMKYDMGGAGAVAGLLCALAGRKAKVNAVGVLGIVENMPDGQAMRPGDVVTSLSGQTIEVINTDAEGRLVLADALWWTKETFKPRFMVDLATLTGAIVVGLGNDYAGLFSNDDALSGQLLAAGVAEGETLWRMPLPPAYEKQIDSVIADMKNIGGRPGGSITAALFLQRFVDKTPWAHLDIAATAWRKPSTTATVPEGASGFGVRLLNRLVADNFEG